MSRGLTSFLCMEIHVEIHVSMLIAGNPVFQVPCDEQTILSQLIGLGILVKKSIGCRCMGLFLDSKLYAMSLHVCWCASTTMFWFLWLCYEFWNLEISALQFLSSFSWLFWISRTPCNYIWIWGLTFPFLGWEEGHWNFDKDCVESVGCFKWD